MKYLYICIALVSLSTACTKTQNHVSNLPETKGYTEKVDEAVRSCNADVEKDMLAIRFARAYWNLQEKQDVIEDPQRRWEITSRQMDLLIQSYELEEKGKMSKMQFSCIMRAVRA